MSSIFFISLMNGASWGGSEELWYKTALHIAKKGGTVGCAIYYWQEKENRINQLADAGCSIYYLPNKGRSKKNLFQKIQFKLNKKITLVKAIKSLPVNAYDLFVINLGEFEVLSSVWKDFYKRLNSYSLLFHNYKEEANYKLSKKIILKNWIGNANINLFASKRIQEVLENKLNIKISNGELLINPITFETPDQFTPYPDLKNGNYIFLMLAALDIKRKAQDNLILALSTPKWKDRNWLLYLYGEGDDKKVIQDLINEKNLDKKIFLKGHTTNVHLAIENAHLILQLTHMDAMPITVIEAMAIGRPVAASKIGDMPQWVKNDLNGWISQAASIDQINLTLEQAWDQKSQWPDFAKNSFSIFKEKFPVAPIPVFLNQLNYNL